MRNTPEALAQIVDDPKPETVAEMYLSLSDADRTRVAGFVGPSKLARFFARLPDSTKDEIAASLPPTLLDVFLEPFMAVPLRPNETDQIILFAELLAALLRRTPDKTANT